MKNSHLNLFQNLNSRIDWIGRSLKAWITVLRDRFRYAVVQPIDTDDTFK